MPSRICIKCDGNEVDGIVFPSRGNICSACRAAYKAQWYQKNRKRADATHTQWMAEHPERAKTIRSAGYTRWLAKNGKKYKAAYDAARYARRKQERTEGALD